MSKIEELFALIKREYQRVQEPLTINVIRYMSRNILPNSNDLSHTLKYLVRSGRVRIIGDRFRPTDIDYLKNMVETDSKAVIKEENIISILEIFGSGKPEQIARKYLEVYDSNANTETITRKIRKMFEEGKINRDGETYFIDKITSKENSLVEY